MENQENSIKVVTPMKVTNILLAIIAILMLIMLIKPQSSTSATPQSYEYKVTNCDRDSYLQRQVDNLASDGWEYVGVLTNNGLNSKEVLFRKAK